MSSNTIQTLRFNTQARLDIARITRDLTDLQRQIAAGVKSNELSGYGSGASRLLNTQGLVSTTQARAAVAEQLENRFGIQGAALSQAATSVGNLAQAVRDAIAADDVDTLGVQIGLAFSSLVSALNESWNGQPLFAGERLVGRPVLVGSVAALQAATGPQDIFDEALREQIVDLGPASRFVLADKASDLATGSFNAIKALQNMVDSWGGAPPDVLTLEQRADLQALADQLDSGRDTFIAAESRAGQLESRLSIERVRLNERALLLQKEIGDQADVDPAELSIRLSTLLAQYQATAKTFADISALSLVRFLD
jgi:adhesin HecA-like repeat protein